MEEEEEKREENVQHLPVYSRYKFGKEFSTDFGLEHRGDSLGVYIRDRGREIKIDDKTY